MKPLFILATVISSFFVSNSYANEKKVAPIVLKSFQHTFGQQAGVEWSITNQYYKAQFLFNGLHVNAYFNAAGEMIAVTHPIVSTQLPVTLQAKLKNDYSHYWVSDLFEVVKDDVSYYITLENGDTQLILKASPTTNWSVYQKTKK